MYKIIDCIIFPRDIKFYSLRLTMDLECGCKVGSQDNEIIQ